MNIVAEKVVDVYRKISSIPNIISGTLLPTDDSRKYVLECVWQQKDLDRSENIVFHEHSIVNVRKSEIRALGKSSAYSTNNVLLVRYSLCGKMKAVIRGVSDKGQNDVQYLEIWNEYIKIVNINLNTAEKHGPVHCDAQFGSLEWSCDNKKVLYVADIKRPNSKSYFKSIDKDDEFQQGNQHVWKECWREQLSDVVQPTICVFDVTSKNISVYSDVIPSNISAGQAIWHRDCESIIFVGWLNGPYKLGVLFTTTRENHLFLVNARREICIRLTSNDISVRSPRFHPSKDVVVFLKNPIGGPHFHCTELSSILLPCLDELLTEGANCDSEVIVHSVDVPASETDFPGLYLLNLPRNCWSKDGQYIFCTSFWGSHGLILGTEITSGSIFRLTELGFSVVLDIRDDIIVIGHSTPCDPPEIKISKFISITEIQWSVVKKLDCEVSKMTWSVCPFKPDLSNSSFPNSPCEYILYQPAQQTLSLNESRPLIVNPHGGPHTVNITAFEHETVALCELGFSVLQVNYRGSIGFGQSSIDSLPGNIGTQDVNDIHQVTKMLKDHLSFDKVFIEGLSHGGFLTLQLISQYPEFYSAACVKNAVTDLVSMSSLTDLEDWPLWEVEVKNFQYTSLPSPESYAAMISKSPIAKMKNAKIPCLVMVGKSDLRVPPSQGIQWAKMYKSLHKICKVLEYRDNNHFLNGVEAEADGFVNMVLWFKEYENSLEMNL